MIAEREIEVFSAGWPGGEGFEATEHIRRTVEEVWNHLTDWPQAPAWMNGIEEFNGPKRDAVTATYEYRCEPEGDGTRVTRRARCEIRGLLWGLAGPLIRHLMKRSDSGQIAALKRVLGLSQQTKPSH